MMTTTIFLASSSELKDDRKDFEVFINRKNKELVDRGVFIHLEMWEDFLDAVSKTRLQDEYDKAIRECDIFVMLFSTNVGQYTEEEFETAFKQFKDAGKPIIFTYFKNVEVSIGSLNREVINGLCAFQEKLKNLGHYWTCYKSGEDLVGRFSAQLDKMGLQRNIVNVTPSVMEVTSKQEQKAKEVCLNAFVDDMKELSAKPPIVIMLDAYEKCPRYIKDWIEEQLLEQLFFCVEPRLYRLILVIAGRTTPDFERRWSVEDCSTTVPSVRALGKWTKKHVEECLRVFGFDYEPKDLDSFYRLVEIGVPPSQVVQMIQTVVTSQGRQ